VGQCPYVEVISRVLTEKERWSDIPIKGDHIRFLRDESIGIVDFPTAGEANRLKPPITNPTKKTPGNLDRTGFCGIKGTEVQIDEVFTEEEKSNPIKLFWARVSPTDKK